MSPRTFTLVSGVFLALLIVDSISGQDLPWTIAGALVYLIAVWTVWKRWHDKD